MTKLPRDSSSRVSLKRRPLVALTAILLTLFCPALAFTQDEDSSPTDDAVELFQKGQDAHEKGNLKEAIELYDKAIAAVTEFPEAELQKGNALLALGKRDEAEKAFLKAVAGRPEWTLALANLGSLLVGKGSYTEAERYLRKAILLDPQNSLAYSALTELRLRTKSSPEDLKDLLTRLKALTERARPTGSAWAARAALEMALGEKAAARSSFAKALDLDPKNQFALASKATAMLDEGDTAGAEAIIRSLDGSTPVTAQFLRARLLHANGKVDEAISLLNSVENPSADVIAFRDRLVLSKTESVSELEKRLEANARDPFVLGRLCSLYRIDDPAKALAYCRKASEADPENLNHAIGFGAALVQGKMYAEAVELLRRLQKISPDNVTIRANVATALFQLKRYPEARAEYQWIAEKQPSSAITYYFLGITHDQLMEYADAMANYQLFIKYADAEKNKIEIEKVNLRLPTLLKQIKEKKGKRT